jgi:hypothetical protein
MLTATKGAGMSHTVVVTAQIRPGRRAALAATLAEGPPFDLAAEGITRHQAFLGEHELVLVFEGDNVAADVRRLAASLPLIEMTRLATMVSSPAVLSESYEWTAAAV